MSDKSDAKILQVLSRQPRQDRVVDLILAEGRLILFETKLPQPTSDVHGGTLVRLPLHDPPGETACLGRGLNDRFASFASFSAMSAVSPLYPQEPTSPLNRATSEKGQWRTLELRNYARLRIIVKYADGRGITCTTLRAAMIPSVEQIKWQSASTSVAS